MGNLSRAWRSRQVSESKERSERHQPTIKESLRELAKTDEITTEHSHAQTYARHVLRPSDTHRNPSGNPTYVSPHWPWRYCMSMAPMNCHVNSGRKAQTCTTPNLTRETCVTIGRDKSLRRQTRLPVDHITDGRTDI